MLAHLLIACELGANLGIIALKSQNPNLGNAPQNTVLKPKISNLFYSAQIRILFKRALKSFAFSILPDSSKFAQSNKICAISLILAESALFSFSKI